MEEEPAPVKPKPIVVEIVAQAVAATSDSVAEAAAQEMQAAERDRLAKRAEKFGVKEVAEPVPGVTVPLVRKFRKPKGVDAFAVGFDVFGEEEEVKKDLRMHRFGSVGSKKEEQPKAAEPVVAKEDEAWKGDAEKKESRAARFGAVKRDLEDKESKQAKEEAVAAKKKARSKRVWRLPRTEASATAAVRDDTLYVHGCDKLKSDQVFALFSVYGPKTLEWINDSSCNVTFAEAFSAKRALRGLGTKEAEPEDTAWYEAEEGRSLRLATEADVKAAFFDAQPAQERKLKEKKFGPALKKTAGKRERELKNARQVEMQVRSTV